MLLYGNERNCTHLHASLTRMGYTEAHFVKLLERHGTLHEQPQPVIKAGPHVAPTGEQNSSDPRAWRDWGYPSERSQRSRFYYSSRSLYLVRLGSTTVQLGRP